MALLGFRPSQVCVPAGRFGRWKWTARSCDLPSRVVLPACSFSAGWKGKLLCSYTPGDLNHHKQPFLISPYASSTQHLVLTKNNVVIWKAAAGT